MSVDAQHDVHYLAIVKLTDALGVAGFAIQLRVHLVVDIRGKGGKSIFTIVAYDERFHRSGAGIGNVDDGVRQRDLGQRGANRCRCLSMDTAEGYLPQALPVAHRVPVERRPRATTNSGRVVSIIRR